jgi:pimeloyl-ACP methyl ester carboxylesterase
MWPGRSVLVHGQDLFVRTTPAGDHSEPALCVHGLGGSSPNWTDFAGLVRGQLAVESIDLLGHGRSGPAIDGRYTPGAHARAVINYLDQSGRGPVHLIGNSMGGAVSIRVAAERPDLVRTLTLISPAVPDTRLRMYPLRYNPRMAVMALPRLGELAMARSAIPAADRVAMTIRLCFADRTRYPQSRLDEAIAEMTVRQKKPWANDAMLRSMRNLARASTIDRRATWARLGRITAPALVLWGDTDRLVAPDLAPVVAGRLSNARLLVLDDTGHTAQMEDPTRTARAVLALVEDARTQRIPS